MEGTATWMEDEVYDSVNDNRQYLPQSPLKRPDVPVDFSSDSYLPYGSSVFWKYLSDSAAPGRLASDPSIVREVWETARPETVYSTLALRRVLEAHGRTVTGTFRDFGVWNRMPGLEYSEGRTYPGRRRPRSSRSAAVPSRPRSSRPWSGTWPTASSSTPLRPDSPVPGGSRSRSTCLTPPAVRRRR